MQYLDSLHTFKYRPKKKLNEFFCNHFFLLSLDIFLFRQTNRMHYFENAIVISNVFHRKFDTKCTKLDCTIFNILPVYRLGCSKSRNHRRREKTFSAIINILIQIICISSKLLTTVHMLLSVLPCYRFHFFFSLIDSDRLLVSINGPIFVRYFFVSSLR